MLSRRFLSYLYDSFNHYINEENENELPLKRAVGFHLREGL